MRQMRERIEKLAMNDNQWYVAAMNDCIFIIDREPRPTPVDHVNPSLPVPSVVISMRSGSRETQEIAERIVEAHNKSVCTELR